MIAETEVLPPEDFAPLDLAAMDPAVLELAVDAAMRERFQPSQLLAHWAERQPAPVVEQLSVEAMDLSLLLGSAAEGASDVEGVALPLAMRRAILAAAGAEGLQASITRQAPQTLVERTFCGLIEGHAPETADLDRGALLALITASGWAEGLEGAAQVSVAGTAQQARDREFVERVGGTDLGLFVGRESLLRGLANLWTLPDRPVTLIEGPGGMGKSIAVARFFQSLLAGENGLPRPDAILHLDFDLPNLQVATALDLAVEAVRQLALRWTEGDPEHLLSLLRGFSSAAGSARGAARKGAASQTVVRSGPSWVTPAALLAEALARFGVGHSRPLRLVLFADSFERIQRLDEVAAGNVGQIVAALQAAEADVMVIYAARAYRDVDALGRGGRVSTQRLKRFEQAEAVDYLIAKSQRRGIRLSRRDADRANRKVNGWPLGLRMAVSMLGQSAADFDVETWLASLDAGGRSTQATLYERLLDRLRDPDLRKLAKPGLIVRRLTAAVIDHVLAGPCGLDADVTGQDLMRRAEDEGQLFARDLSDAGALWHRQDLREVMLPVLRIDVPAPVARAIHDGAVAFYAAEAGDVARAEELYHRLCRGDPRAAIAARWDHGAGQRLVGALDELPRAAAATLRLLLGGGRSDEAEGGLEELRAVARNRLADGNAEQSDLFQQAGVAEDILSPLGDIRAEALLRQGMVDEVLSGAEALRKRPGVPAPVRARVAITAAGGAEGLGEVRLALDFWKDAAGLWRHLEPLEHLTVRVGLARVLRKTGAAASVRRRQTGTALALLDRHESEVTSHRVLRLEVVAELSEGLVPMPKSRLTPEVEQRSAMLRNMFRRLSPMFPSALTNRGRIARLAELLGADPDLVHTPYDLDRLTLSRFSTDRPEETAQALAALRDEVDEAFAAAVRPASDGSDPDSLGGANLSYS